MRYALYVRVSTDEQADNASIPAQIRLCEEYVQKRGGQVVEVYRDVASGTTIDRPALQRMLLGAQDGKFDAVVAKNPDRLARGNSVFVPVKGVLKDARVRIEYVEEEYREDPMSQAMQEVRQAFSGLEASLIRQRAHTARVERAKGGLAHHHGRPLFGYKWDTGSKRYVVDEVEAPWVEQVFAWYVEGVSVGEIVRRLRDMGAPIPRKANGETRSEYGWTREKVSTLVQYEQYTGRGWANRYYSNKEAKERGSKYRPEDEWVKIEKAYPPIIDRDTFDAAQARRQYNRENSRYNRARVEYLLVGKLWCAECGKRFASITSTARGKVYRYYACGGMHRYPHLFQCRDKNLWADDVEERVWSRVERVLTSPHLIWNEYVRSLEVGAQGRQSAEARIAEAREKLQELATEKARLVSGVQKGIFEADDIAPQMKAVRERVEFWEGEITRGEGSIKQAGIESGRVQSFFAAVEEFMSGLQAGWTPEDRKRAVEEFVVDVHVGRDGVPHVALSHLASEAERVREEALIRARDESPVLARWHETFEALQNGGGLVLSSRRTPLVRFGVAL
ncbi:MAG: recombinase family protein [Chloroflexota bacterium]|nr:recombinase family protein [Chloroflexota bacterium]